MGLAIKKVTDESFLKYGRIVTGHDFGKLLQELEEKTPAPSDSVVYVPAESCLENTVSFKELSENVYGGMPIQIGYCNGYNTKLNCLEYHRDSEIDIAGTDCILLLAEQQSQANGKMLDSSMVEAFFCPAGTAVELYATTLHYAPCSAKKGESFKVVIVLPKGTNYEKPVIEIKNDEDRKLFASNKWLIAHKDASEVEQGAVIGISGDNIDIASLI